MDEHLGYAKGQRKEVEDDNLRNGASSKNIITEHSSLEIAPPVIGPVSLNPKSSPRTNRGYRVLMRKFSTSTGWEQVSENGVTHARKWLYQIITQCPKTLSARKKAERLLAKLDESLF